MCSSQLVDFDGFWRWLCQKNPLRSAEEFNGTIFVVWGITWEQGKKENTTHTLTNPNPTPNWKSLKDIEFELKLYWITFHVSIAWEVFKKKIGGIFH